MPEAEPTARLTVDTAAISANWRAFAAAAAPAAAGAALKADGYGLGGREAAAAVSAAGCRDIFVAHWGEAAALGALPGGARIAVLHGVMPGEMPVALASPAVPVLVTAAQVAAWRETGRPCDVMIDTGMNRIGLSPAEAVSGLLDGLAVDTLHSHLACAETPAHPLNARQLADFRALAAAIPARRRALASSAGTGLGPDYHFDLVRPGLGLFGGGGAPGVEPLRPVVALAARVVQVRAVAAGHSVGYGATFTAPRPMRLAVAALGYADGYVRALGNLGAARVGGVRCPVAGRVSMDLTAFDVTDAPPVAEGEWIAIDFALPAVAAATGRSQYELLTGLGHRYSRCHR